MDTVLHHMLCVTTFPPSVRSVDMRISGGRIAEVKKHLIPRPGDESVDLSGCLVMPGLVNAHTHLYSSLSRGMPPARKAPADFPEMLKRIWWKLDRALDEESIYYSALAGAVEAVMCGTTTIVDHHASPGSIAGSLDLVSQAMREAGVRGVLCYEVTDRGGKKKRDEGLRENERFIRAHARDEQVRGIVGAHASFTLSDESLGLCGSLASDLGTGVHIHAAEDISDVTDARTNHGCTVTERFLRHGIARRGSILAHCVHCSEEEIREARDAGCMLVHNPRSNMNNRVGYAPVGLFGTDGALGTDGFPSDLFEEAGYGFFKNRDAHAAAADMTVLLGRGQQFASELFGLPMGVLEKGAAADLVVLDYASPTPLTKENIGGHFLFGMRSSMVRSVMAGGKWIMRDRTIPGIDREKLSRQTQRIAKKLWERIDG